MVKELLLLERRGLSMFKARGGANGKGEDDIESCLEGLHGAY